MLVPDDDSHDNMVEGLGLSLRLGLLHIPNMFSVSSLSEKNIGYWPCAEEKSLEDQGFLPSSACFYPILGLEWDYPQA